MPAPMIVVDMLNTATGEPIVPLDPRLSSSSNPSPSAGTDRSLPAPSSSAAPEMPEGGRRRGGKPSSPTRASSRPPTDAIGLTRREG